MHLSNITLYVNVKTDNSHISFVNLYCLLHQSFVSYIINWFYINVSTFSTHDLVFGHHKTVPQLSQLKVDGFYS